uniref:Thioredoxin domain-containing protein n=1 Tax=Sphenodon punctatus TaxID=8508 RepID=A0A8D0HMD3_SPHPU
MNFYLFSRLIQSLFQFLIQITLNNQELWEEMLGSKGLIVVDAYQGWSGPCKTVVNLFRKIRNELGDDLLHFAVAEVDSIDALEKYRGKCEPTFLFYAGGELVAVIRGANAPLLQKTMLEQLEAEKKVLEQGVERVVVIISCINTIEQVTAFHVNYPLASESQQEEALVRFISITPGPHSLLLTPYKKSATFYTE